MYVFFCVNFWTFKIDNFRKSNSIVYLEVQEPDIENALLYTKSQGPSFKHENVILAKRTIFFKTGIFFLFYFFKHKEMKYECGIFSVQSHTQHLHHLQILSISVENYANRTMPKSVPRLLGFPASSATLNAKDFQEH